MENLRGKKKPGPKKVNTITINKDYQAVYEITSMGWILQKRNLETEEWDALCYPSSFEGCLKAMVRYEFATKAKNITEVIQTIRSFEETIKELLKIPSKTS